MFIICVLRAVAHLPAAQSAERNVMNHLATPSKNSTIPLGPLQLYRDPQSAKEIFQRMRTRETPTIR